MRLPPAQTTAKFLIASFVRFRQDFFVIFNERNKKVVHLIYFGI